MYETLLEAVSKNSRLILDAERHIWKNPETGFKEWKTSKYLEDAFEGLGYKIVKAGNIPGFYTDLDTGKPGPKILIFGEMDSLICGEHPEADPETRAVHCCGHNAQCAALLGIAAALKEEGVLNGLSGSVRLCAVPAEEGIQISYREELRKNGTIRYFSGKSEFLYRGYFDDVDMAFMIHTTDARTAVITQGSVGNVRKMVRYKGVSAHAGYDPASGINALYAATLGLQAINSLRETFREADLVRVHPIITNGGAAVNAIPSDVRLESYVRGKTFEIVERENKRINRALIGAAVSMGAHIEITDRSGYYPLNNDPNLVILTRDAMECVLGKSNVEMRSSFGAGSTDMGDLSAVMPVVQPYMPGAVGRSHGSDYYIINPQSACVESAKVQLLMLRMLLTNNAKKARYILNNKKVRFETKEDYFQSIKAIESEGERISYLPDGGIRII